MGCEDYEKPLRKRAILFIRMPIRLFTLQDFLKRRSEERDLRRFHGAFLNESREMPNPFEDSQYNNNIDLMDIDMDMDMSVPGLYEYNLNFT